MTTPTRLPSVEEARRLAVDLVAELGQTPGDPAAVSVTLLRWAEELEPSHLGMVCMAAVQLTFADCLTMRRLEDWPVEGGATLDLPERTNP